MSAWRTARVVATVTVMFGVAAFLVWQGMLLVSHPGRDVPPWLGWALVGAGLFKTALWGWISSGLLRHRDLWISGRH